MFIAGRSFQADAHPWFSTLVAEKLRLRSILSGDQIDSTIGVKICNGTAPLLAIGGDATLLSRHSRELAFAIASEDQAATGVESSQLRIDCKKVLREAEILVAVTIEVRDRNPKGRA